MATPDMDVIKEIPGYKVILKAVLKAQIQQLIEQLAASTDEESVILTASVAEGTLSHLGSELGKGFLEDHEDVKSQFLGFCLKRQHQKQKEEEEKKRQQEMRNSMQQVTSPTYLGYGHGPMGNPGFLPRGPGTGFPVRRGIRTRGVRHEPYSQMPRQRAPSGSMPIPPVKPELSEASNDSLNDSNNEYQSQSHSASSKDENQSNSVQSNESYTGGSGSDNEQSSECTRVKVESISESDLELEITGVEPGRPLLSPDWDPNVSMGMGSGEDSQGQSLQTANGKANGKADGKAGGNGDRKAGRKAGRKADGKSGGKGDGKAGRKAGFPCDICGKVLTTKGNYGKHVKVHSGHRPHVRSDCGKSDQSALKSASNPVATSRKKSKKKQRIFCEVCDRDFANKKNLKRHRLIHTGEKRHACITCGMRFTQKVTLRRHITCMHKDISPGLDGYKEPDGIKKVVANGNTQPSPANSGEHKDISPGLDGYKEPDGIKGVVAEVITQPYPANSAKSGQLALKSASSPIAYSGKKRNKNQRIFCAVCDRDFANVQNLLRHRLIHTGEKRHECIQCRMRFTQKATLRRHINYMHKDISSGLDGYKEPDGIKEVLADGNKQTAPANSGEHKDISPGLDGYKEPDGIKEVVAEGNTQPSPANSGQLDSDSRKFTCNICGKIFSKKYGATHLRTNWSVKPYQCTVCGKGFTDSSNYRKHVPLNSYHILTINNRTHEKHFVFVLYV